MLFFPQGQVYRISCSNKHFCFYLEFLVEMKQNERARLFGRHQRKTALEENKTSQVMIGGARCHRPKLSLLSALFLVLTQPFFCCL